MPKRKTITDPHAEREASRYDKPIPSREFIMQHLDARGEPVLHADLCRELGLKEADSRDALLKRLNAMCRDGQLICSRAGTYGLVNKMDLIKGRIMGHKDGFGFVIPDDGSGDLYLSPRQMQHVFDGDRVLARVSGYDRRGRREGKIVEILTRHSTRIVGRFYKEAGAGVVVPHNKRITQEILISKKHRLSAKDGDFVVVEITNFPYNHRKASGEIVEVLGDIATPGLEIQVAIHTHEIPDEWPKNIKKQLHAIPDAPKPEDIRQRTDYRNLAFVTIDGEDAKDFDDAVYCAKKGKGWELYVAIADVSHYVPVYSPLDEEARNRGNSVYFPGFVVPMLPEKLSNGLCSLRPEEDRLVMVCRMQISAGGDITGYDFSEGVIHSRARLTYTEVAAMLQAPADDSEAKIRNHLRGKYQSLTGDLENLYALYKQLHRNREQRGALDFETVETRIIFGEDQKLREIIPVIRNDAHRLIEECMLCANVCAAQLLLEAKLPALYRVHAGPNPEKVENLYDFLRAMGIGLARKANPTTTDYQNILKRLEDRPDRELLQTIVIRSLMQAVYQPDNIGHFGLGFDAYTHFTSPIRRYPDLLVHRAVRFLIRGGRPNPHLVKQKSAPVLKKKDIYPYSPSQLEELGEHLSGTERRADAASYDVEDWLKCEYMKQHLGGEFDGTVVSVINFGLFVELDDIYIEGLVHVTALHNDYYHFDEVSHSLTGEHTGRTWQLGDRVRVQVARVDLDDHKIDLELIDGGGGGRIARGRRTIPKRQRSRKKDDGKRSGRKDDRHSGKKGGAKGTRKRR